MCIQVGAFKVINLRSVIFTPRVVWRSPGVAWHSLQTILSSTSLVIFFIKTVHCLQGTWRFGKAPDCHARHACVPGSYPHWSCVGFAQQYYCVWPLISRKPTRCALLIKSSPDRAMDLCFNTCYKCQIQKTLLHRLHNSVLGANKYKTYLGRPWKNLLIIMYLVFGTVINY